MKKIMTAVVVRQLGTCDPQVTAVINKIIYNCDSCLYDPESDLKEQASIAIQKFKNDFPEFNEAKFWVSIHEDCI